MQIAFVFTNYNNSNITIEAINSIKSIKSNCVRHVVIVDNNSSDLEKNILKEKDFQDENIHVIFNDNNLGYFNGLNCGLQYLYSHKDKMNLIVVGNNDLVFPEDFIENLLKIESKLHEYPVISPNIITLDGVHQNPHVIKGLSKFRELIYDVYYSNYYFSIIIGKLAKLTKSFTDRSDEQHHDIPQTIYQGYGACYILTNKFIQEFKLLWAPTFIMSEEFFLSLQLEKKGYKIFYEPSIIINHHCHATMGQLHSKFMWKLARDAHKEYRKYVKIF